MRTIGLEAMQRWLENGARLPAMAAGGKTL